jgi:hypothetical protein
MKNTKAPWEEKLWQTRIEYIAKNKELIDAAMASKAPHQEPLFDSHIGIYQQGIFKVGVRDYFRETGQSLGSRHGYDN